MDFHGYSSVFLQVKAQRNRFRMLRGLIEPCLGHLRHHPLFELTANIFPQTFADFCSALEKQFYSEGQFVFSIGSLAEMMYITSHGNFSIGAPLLSLFHIGYIYSL